MKNKLVLLLAPLWVMQLAAYVLLYHWLMYEVDVPQWIIATLHSGGWAAVAFLWHFLTLASTIGIIIWNATEGQS